MNLTDYNKRNVLFSAGGVPGLHMQITPNGGRSWVLRVKVGTLRRDIGLGGFPGVTLSMARERAREARTKIENGVDPVEERKAVKAALIAAQRRGLTGGDTDQDAATAIETIEIWPSRVDGGFLAEEIRDRLKAHVVFGASSDADCATLWIIGSYLMDDWRLWPRLLVTSPTKACGKSTLLETIDAMAHRGFIVSNASPAAIFRAIEAWKPTLLLDEADTWMKQNEELAGILNSGHLPAHDPLSDLRPGDRGAPEADWEAYAGCRTLPITQNGAIQFCLPKKNKLGVFLMLGFMWGRKVTPT